MIKAGSLFYAIVISLIISIVSSSLILFAYLSHIQFESFEISQRMQLNADSGLNLLMSEQTIVGLNEKKILDLYGDEIDSVELTRRYWGAYEIVVSKAVFKNLTVVRAAQVGYLPDTAKKYSLYLSDEDKPLVLAGKTSLKGTAYLPKAGAKGGVVDGQNFSGGQFVDGLTKVSEKELPAFDEEFVKGIEELIKNGRVSQNDSVVEVGTDISMDSLKNDYSLPSLVLFNKAPIRVSGGSYLGNVLIVSEQKVTITSASKLFDVIVVAPKVFVEEGFSGNMQLFASDSIYIEKNVKLDYPSVLGVMNSGKSPEVSAICLTENDSVFGSLFVYGNPDLSQKRAALAMKGKNFIYGQVYSNGAVEIKGSVYGSVMSKKIFLKAASSFYEGYLLNAEIDRDKLSRNFVGINLSEGASEKKIVKWEN